MTDVELGEALCPDAPHVGAWLAHHMHPNKRAVMVRLIEVADQANLWTAGLGPKPQEAILCGSRRVRRAGKRR